jgi:hypothetical protein
MFTFMLFAMSVVRVCTVLRTEIHNGMGPSTDSQLLLRLFTFFPWFPAGTSPLHPLKNCYFIRRTVQPSVISSQLRL